MIKKKYYNSIYMNKYAINIEGEVINLKTMKKLKNSITIRGYEVVNLNKKTYYIHRLLALTYIPNPNKYNIVDHINGIKSDNRLENLRWCCQKTNLRNCKLSSRNKIGYRGISINKNHIIASYVCCNTGKQIHKSFNINNLGFIEAVKKAVIHRYEMEKNNGYYIKQTPENYFNSDEYKKLFP